MNTSDKKKFTLLLIRFSNRHSQINLHVIVKMSAESLSPATSSLESASVGGDRTVLIGHGAEGKVYRSSFLKRPSIVKQRVKKNYRLEVLDNRINKTRLLQEAKCISKARRAGVNVPCIYYVDQSNYKLHMEQIIGKTLKEVLASMYNKDSDTHYPEYCLVLAKKVGRSIGLLHDAEVVHGDLTTSNIMVQLPSGCALTAAEDSTPPPK